MTRKELEIELLNIGVTEKDYSINDGLKTDAYIIEEYSNMWRFFYYDEKGEMSNLMLLKSESDAYTYLLSEFNKQLKILGKNSFRLNNCK